jgi:hypothetical protein
MIGPHDLIDVDSAVRTVALELGLQYIHLDCSQGFTAQTLEHLSYSNSKLALVSALDTAVHPEINQQIQTAAPALVVVAVPAHTNLH